MSKKPKMRNYDKKELIDIKELRKKYLKNVIEFR
jgi:hypothetical protein